MKDRDRNTQRERERGWGRERMRKIVKGGKIMTCIL